MKTDLKIDIEKARWQPAKTINRNFVLYYHNDSSPGYFWNVKPSHSEISLSIIIPTIDADRNGYFKSLLGQLCSQTRQDFELIVVKADPRQGRAINIGASIAQGKYLLTLDDDTSLPDKETFAKLIDVMERHLEIGLAGGNNIIPIDVSCLVRRAMKEIPRRSWKPVTKIVDSDLAEHPCLIMRTREFKSVGGENELLPRGLDPYLRQAFRNIGKRVVLVPNVIYHHLPPDSLGKLIRQFFRNGRQAAYVNRRYPQWVIETPSKHGYFKPNVPLCRRLLRYLLNIPLSIFSGKLIWTICQIDYAIGFLYESITYYVVIHKKVS